MRLKQIKYILKVSDHVLSAAQVQIIPLIKLIVEKIELIQT